ncbi:MAG: alginate export family protein [Gammaproteobacteria bacterium]
MSRPIRWPFTLLLLAAIAGPVRAGEDPWRLGQALGVPAWLSLGGEYRVRLENLDNQFRAGRRGGDQVLVHRTSLLARIDLPSARIVAEALDARASLADAGTPLSTADVNPIDLLQAYLELTLRDAPVTGGTSVLRLGRFTMDMGSRRLVARNRYRNTINAFTGADWTITGASQTQTRLFFVLPVQRLAGTNLLEAEAQADDQSGDVRLWGFHHARGGLPANSRGEFYVLGLDERDDDALATRDRRLYTAGLRLYRDPVPGAFDFQIESALQFGESRASASAADRRDLDHRAHFQHVEVGYSFQRPWKPRLVVQYDYASGDDSPLDDENNQFDTLFGARRFDFGPTGGYGAFARANISSPGLRLLLAPSARVKIMAALRGFWLASDRDAWTGAGVRDATGNSGSYIGTQAEAEIRWSIIPGNLDLETGIAHVSGGGLMERPPGNGNGDPTYVFLAATFTF